MADPDGITGTFFWTPPSGDIPPVTVTISSTVTAAREAPHATEAAKESLKPSEQSPKPPETARIPVETPRVPVEVPQRQEESPRTPQQTLQAPPEAPQSSRAQVAPQVVPPETVVNAPLPSPSPSSNTPRPSAPTSSPNEALPSTRTRAPTPVGSPFSTVIAVTGPWKTTPTADTPSAAPSHSNRGVVIGLCSGGAVLVAAFIAVMLYTRHRRNQALSRRNVIKSQIGNPVVPPPLPPPARLSFARGTKAREMEMLPVAPLRTRTPPRAVSSVYGSDRDLHARDTIGSFSGSPYAGEFLDRGPFDLRPLYPRPSRSLLTPSRRSSLLSNYRPHIDESRGSWEFAGLDAVGEDGPGEDEWEARRRIFQT